MVELRRDWTEVIINMQREVGRLVDDVARRKPPTVRFSPKKWEPAIDVCETDDEVVVCVDIAGVKEEEIEVIVQDNILTVRGERRDSRRGIRRTYSQMEILWGPFERDVVLPANVNSDQVKAFYEGGLLEVILPKLNNEEKPRRIDIKVS